MVPADVASLTTRCGRHPGRSPAGPIDVWVNDAMTTVFAPLQDVEPAEFQRAVEVTFLGQVWGTMAAFPDAAPRPGQHRQCRVRARLRRHPAAVGLLLVQIRLSGILRVIPGRAPARGQPCSAEHGPPPRGQHPQFDWCETTLDHHPAARPTDLPAGVPAKFIVDVAIDGRRSKIVGSWNKMLVLMDSLSPGLGNQYARSGPGIPS